MANDHRFASASLDELNRFAPPGYAHVVDSFGKLMEVVS
jgi:hypothetical protein